MTVTKNAAEPPPTSSSNTTNNDKSLDSALEALDAANEEIEETLVLPKQQQQQQQTTSFDLIAKVLAKFRKRREENHDEERGEMDRKRRGAGLFETVDERTRVVRERVRERVLLSRRGAHLQRFLVEMNGLQLEISVVCRRGGDGGRR